MSGPARTLAMALAPMLACSAHREPEARPEPSAKAGGEREKLAVDEARRSSSGVA